METEGALLSTVINCIKGRLIKANLLQWLSGYIGVSALPDALWFREHVLAVIRFKYSYSSPTLWGITRSYPLSQLHIISLHLHSYSLLHLFPHTHLWFPAQLVATGWGGDNWTGASWNLRCVFETICRARCSFLWSFCMTVMQEVCTVVPGDYALLSVGNVKRVGGVYKQYPLSLA